MKCLPAKPKPDAPESSELAVPMGHCALVIRDGSLERIYPPGRYRLAPGRHKLEVRLLLQGGLTGGSASPADDRHAALPFERAFRYVDGTLVAVVKNGAPEENIAEIQLPLEKGLALIEECAATVPGRSACALGEGLLEGLNRILPGTKKTDAAWRSR